MYDFKIFQIHFHIWKLNYTIANLVIVTGFAPKVFDIAFLIDVTYYSYQVKNIMTFFKSITNTLNVASYQTRISIAKMSSVVSLVIDFKTATSNIAVEDALDDLDRSYGTINTEDAFIFARGTMFTEENGARSDVSDILIMLKDGIYSDSNSDVEEAAQKLRESGVYVMIAEEDTTRLKDVADQHSSFRSATTISLNDTLNLFTSGFPCNYCKFNVCCVFLKLFFIKLKRGNGTKLQNYN